jgi:hypothetical protein
MCNIRNKKIHQGKNATDVLSVVRMHILCIAHIIHRSSFFLKLWPTNIDHRRKKHLVVDLRTQLFKWPVQKKTV